MSAAVEEVGIGVVADAAARGDRVIDVRESFEYEAGHIPGAEHVPMRTVPVRLDELTGDAPLYIVCASGGRSWQVASFLLRHGITAFNVTGGMVAWQAVGHPDTTGGAP
jgi:rhodanese-related sulfurtransferase